TRDGVTEDLNPGDPNVQFALQCDHLADAIRDGTEIITPGEMGLRDMALIEAIYRSAAEGREITL
ncbi:MAG TPA: gfo/Idh/MocA family oxidoreductase, partial [Hyphomonas atlantica]|nr:gfo/Idh/MocA family oxidoreductase [Hyphomonas atlantica]